MALLQYFAYDKCAELHLENMLKGENQSIKILVGAASHAKGSLGVLSGTTFV